MALKAMPFFAKVSRIKMKNLVNFSEVKKGTRGSIVLREGEQVRGFYITLKGEFRVTKKIAQKPKPESVETIKELHTDPYVNKLM